jgi:hypothetical protein
MSRAPDYPRGQTIDLPLVEIDGRLWILLKDVSKAFHFRATNIDNPKQVREPSDHRCFESRAEGSVKCSATRVWDISHVNSKLP